MKRFVLGLSVSCLVVSAWGDVVVRPNVELGPVKRIHGVNNGPAKARKDQCRGNFDAYAAAEIPSARLHDAAYCSTYGGRHTVDISNVFPDFNADENDPKSYDFAWTDKYLGDIRAAGTEVYYRLGQSIEHGIKQYYVYPPKDYAKWARIAEHVIRHYNGGWANGFRWNIRHWEIWNEPDNMDPPTCWGGNEKQFFAFFETVAKHLKGCFPDLLIGGPAVAYGDANGYIDRFLDHVKGHQVPIDFFSWHRYERNPRAVGAKAREMRQKLDDRGLKSVQSHVTEWNYVTGWSTEWPYTIRVESGDLRHKGAAYIAAVFTEFQSSPVDLAHFYDARVSTTMNSLFAIEDLRPMQGYYAFYAWSKLVRLGASVEAKLEPADPDGDLYVSAAKGADGRLGVLVSRFNDDDNIQAAKLVTLRLADASMKGAIAHLTDRRTLYTETKPLANEDGSVSIWMEPGSFAYLESTFRLQ